MKILKRIVSVAAVILLVLYLGLIAFAYWPTGIEEVPARALATPEDKFVAIEGHELRYRTYGTPGEGKPNVVLLHGMGNSLQSFRFLAPLLADNFYAVAVDLPGFGLSAKPVEFDYRAPNMGRLVGEFIRTVGLKRAVIAGHSMGGSIALHTALLGAQNNEPEISGLILMNPGIISDGVPKFTKYMPFPFQRISAKQFGDRKFRESFLKVSYVNPALVTEQVMDDLQLASKSEGYLAGSTSMMGQYADPPALSLLNDITVPTLIAWGLQDRNKPPAELEQLRNALTGTRVEVVAVEASGHYVHEEGAAPVAAAMKAMAADWR